MRTGGPELSAPFDSDSLFRKRERFFFLFDDNINKVNKNRWRQHGKVPTARKSRDANELLYLNLD